MYKIRNMKDIKKTQTSRDEKYNVYTEWQITWMNLQEIMLSEKASPKRLPYDSTDITF